MARKPGTPLPPVPQPAAGLAEAGPLFHFDLEAPLRSTPPALPAAVPLPGPDGHRKRLRDRFLRGGPDALADYELLEMLLFAAMPRADTKPLAKALMARFGSFGQAVSAPEPALRDIPGVGDAVLASLRLVRAAALRLLAEEVRAQPVLDNWERLLAYLRAALSREPVEQFRVLFLDTGNRLLADEAQGRGTVNHTPAYPREILRRALELGATAVILVHNHPGGDPTPSRADLDTTEAIRRAAEALGVVLHDHLIVGSTRTLSFRREGLLRG